MLRSLSPEFDAAAVRLAALDRAQEQSAQHVLDAMSQGSDPTEQMATLSQTEDAYQRAKVNLSILFHDLTDPIDT